MRKLPSIGLAAIAALLFAAPAMASTSMNFRATFVDPLGGPVSSPFSCPAGQATCGSGEVVGVGQATEFITETGCPGPACSRLLHVVFTDGSSVVAELQVTGFQAPPGFFSQPPSAFGHPFSVTLTAVVDPGLSTGMFAGATGTLTGEASLAGAMQILTVSGTITLA